MKELAARYLFGKKPIAILILWTAMLGLTCAFCLTIPLIHVSNGQILRDAEEFPGGRPILDHWYLESPRLFSFSILSFYALGCGCVAFSKTKNARSPKRAALRNFLFFLLSISLLFAIGAEMMRLLNAEGFKFEMSMRNSGFALAMILLTSLNWYVCGALFSYLTAHPLKSGVYGAALAAIGNYFAFASLGLSYNGWNVDSRFALLTVVWIAVLYLVAVGLLVADARKRGNAADLSGQ